MTNYKPKFSVLMANYNKSAFIKKAIKSVLAQAYSNWELVIVDDASIDNSVEIIKPFLSDKRIRMHCHKKNLGCGQTKKDCAYFAEGEILGILDSDDALGKNTLEIFINTYQRQSSYGVIYSTYYECDEQLVVCRQSPWARAVDTGITNLKKSYASHFLTFKKSAYLKTEGFCALQKKAVDKDIIYKLEEITDFFYINQPLYFYRMHNNGISLGKNEQAASAYAIYAKYKAFLRRKKTKISNFNNKEMSDLLLKGSFKFFISSSFSNSLKLFFLSIKLNPINTISALYKFAKKYLRENSIFSGRLNKIEKHKKEMEYWENRKKEESILSNLHFEFFYTGLFNIDKSFYSGKKILDIGCGPRGSLEWAENALERVGLDPLVNKYKTLEIEKHKMKYVNTGSENIPFSDEYFDAVFSFNSLDHVDDLDETIKEIQRVLKSGGIFLLITEFNHKPTICEPHSYSDDEIIDRLKQGLLLVYRQSFVKAKGIYSSIAAGRRYIEESRLPGALIAKFIKE